MVNSWFVIANPTSGNSKLSKKQREIKQLLKNHKIDFTFTLTDYSRHEITLIHDAIQQGYRKIISVGGDGTLHNIVNGIMTQNIVKTSDVTVAVIPLGTGNDWIKTYNIPNNIEKAVEIIANEKTILQDIGYLELEDKTAYFNNVAGLGFDGYVTKELTNFKHLGPISYLISGVLGLIKYRSTEFTIITDSETIKTKSLMTLFGVCSYCSGGMKLTPYKSSQDGLLDITIAKNFGLLDILLNVKKLFKGTIFSHKKIDTAHTKSITVIPPNTKKTFIQADGELIGTGKVTATILEKALRFVVS